MEGAAHKQHTHACTHACTHAHAFTASMHAGHLTDPPHLSTIHPYQPLQPQVFIFCTSHANVVEEYVSNR